MLKSLKYSKNWDLNSKVIQDLMIEGYSVHAIAYMTGLSTVSISNKFKSIKEQMYIEEVTKASSDFTGEYEWSELSPSEKIAYYKYENQKHKAYYEL